MKDSASIAIMIYGESNSGRNALTEEKYKDLAAAFSENGFSVSSVLYNDEKAGELADSLQEFDAVLVWVNPIEQGRDRKQLDQLLTAIAAKGCYVSTHPEVILKMGTKDVLFKTKDMGWGGDTKLYNSFEDFLNRFPAGLQASGIRVLKQYRGNGGNGVYKIIVGPAANEVTVVHAIAGNEKKTMSLNEFFTAFKIFFSDNGKLIDQEWNRNIINGMVRCYLSGNKVAGFGYQEINALYEINNIPVPPGKRYYFAQNCGLFSDLKDIMETKWVPELQERLAISNEMMPVIWDADFFINSINVGSVTEKYTLCEINVSCVSPFPPSAIPFIVDAIRDRVDK
ncbi:MAG TPA: Cj0069 family protein [Chitinophagaceae bacterium]|nr:Cj0069 family protein [Chitinophagaceae bacterium]